MRMSQRLPIVLFSIGLCFSGGFAREEWISLRSENFEALSNASKKQSIRLIKELEQFRHVFSEVFHLSKERLPVTVYIFRNDQTFSPFKPTYQGKPAHLAGFFQGGIDRNVIALNANANENPLNVVFHEYVHLLTSDTPHPWPVWLKEGLAELYSTFEVRGQEVILGATISRHSETLRRNSLIPMGDLFRVTHDSAEYNEKDKQGVFYAQSWALVHYLVLHEKMSLRPQFVRFVQLLNRGEEPEAAFREAIKLSFPDLEKELQRYVRQYGLYAAVVRLDAIPAADEIQVTEADQASVEMTLGDLLSTMNRFDEALLHYRKARDFAPRSLAPLEGMALVALRQKDKEKARGYLQETSEGGSGNYLVHYYYAEMMLEEIQGRVTESEFESINRPLQEAIRLAPAFDRPYYLLAVLYQKSGTRLEEGLSLIEKALVLKPQNDYYRVTKANLLLGLKDFDGSRTLLRDLAESTDRGIREYATHNLEYLSQLEDLTSARMRAEEEQRKLMEELSRVPPESSLFGEGDPGASQDPMPGEKPSLQHRDEGPEQEQAEAPPEVERSCRPSFAKVRNVMPLEARLRAVDCSGGNVQYVLEIDGREVRTVGYDPGKPVLFSCSVNVQEMQCGTFSYDAFVYFVPGRERDSASGSLKVLAIEFF